MPLEMSMSEFGGGIGLVGVALLCIFALLVFLLPYYVHLIAYYSRKNNSELRKIAKALTAMEKRESGRIEESRSNATEQSKDEGEVPTPAEAYLPPFWKK